MSRRLVGLVLVAVTALTAGALVPVAAADAAFPVPYDTTRIFLGEEHVVSDLPGFEGEPVTLRWYSNPAYRCGRSGHYSLLVAEPPGLADREAPMWVFQHGGGVGFYDEDGDYHGAQGMNDEEDYASLRDTLVRKIANNRGGPKDTVVARRLAQGWRVVLPSMCDHDLYAGLGTPYPNNPNWGEEGVTVDGLPATLAAIDFAVNGNAAAPGHPTGPIVLHGQSAGSVGVYVVAYAFAQQGVRLNGAVMDAYLVGERVADLFMFHMAPQQLNEPLVDHQTGIEEKIGAFVTDPSLYAEQTVVEGFGVPLFDLVGDQDPFCSGQLPPVPTAVLAGHTNNCVYIHALFAEAIAEQPDTLHRAVVLEGDVHQPTNRRGPIHDVIDGWLDEILAANGAAPWGGP